MDEKIKFKSFDGSKLVGTIAGNLNKDHGVLLVHGLPSDKDEWGFYSDFAKFLEDAAVASLRFDFRYCGESQPGSLQNVSMSEFVNDIDAAYWELRSRLSDSAKVFVVATSAGGGLTLQWLSICQRPISHAFLMAPVLDYLFEVTGKKSSNDPAQPRILDSHSIEELELNGCLNEDAGYGRQMLNDAINFDAVAAAVASKASITIFHGDHDTVVPVELSREFSRMYQGAQLVEIPGCDHGFSAPGDDDLTDPRTKSNHARVYKEVLEKIT